MTHSPLITLEIAVDRANEKGVFVAREMLATLHDTLHSKHGGSMNLRESAPIFRFLIVSTG